MRRGRREETLCIRNPVEGAVSQVAVCREGKREREKVGKKESEWKEGREEEKVRRR